VLYTSAETTDFYALDAETGQQVWVRVCAGVLVWRLFVPQIVRTFCVRMCVCVL
jgi:hypothetical protein